MIKLIKSTFLDETKTKRKLCEFIKKTPVLSMSDECRRFEERFAQKQKRRFAVLVNSGSSANLCLIQALLNLSRLKKGDEVGVSALTWPTNIVPLMQLGLIPVVIDCELSSLNISSNMLMPHFRNLKGLFITNALGFTHDIETIRRLCAKHNIIFIEDNCEGLGSKINGTLLGNFGLASTFSFFVGHHLSTIEGGMICTDDRELYEMLIMVRAHGWDRNLNGKKQREMRKRHNINPFFALYTFYDCGYNFRPTEITGFLGNSQLTHWDSLISRREKNFMLFQRIMIQNPDFFPLEVSYMEHVSNFAMPVVCKTRKLFEHYCGKFQKSGVEIRPIIAGDITQQPFYKKYIPDIKKYPNAEIVHRNGFYFPNNPELTKEEISVINKLLIR